MQVGPIWQSGSGYSTKLQMYLTSPQPNTTISPPYTVTVSGGGKGYSSPLAWEWQPSITSAGQVGQGLAHGLLRVYTRSMAAESERCPLSCYDEHGNAQPCDGVWLQYGGSNACLLDGGPCQ